MADDIVTRLREARIYNCYSCVEYGYDDDCDCANRRLLHNDAADEIERLRAACAMAQDFIDHHINCATILRLRDCNCGFDEVWKALEARRG